MNESGTDRVSAVLGPLGARKLFYGGAGIAILLALIFDLADLVSPPKRVGLLLGALVLVGAGWYVGRLPDERPPRDGPRA